jgi:large subunit ribosomal protein L31e
MAEKKSEKIEREYIIPIREKSRVVARYQKTNKAIKTIKEFLARHMKVRDRDLDKIKLDKYLNEAVWHNGIRSPPHKIKVKATKDEKGIVHAELAEMPAAYKFRKLREDRINKEAKSAVEKKKTLMEKAKETMKGTGAKEEPNTEEAAKSEENKEKEKTSAQATQTMEKETAKNIKHETKMNNEPKHQRRMALQK